MFNDVKTNMTVTIPPQPQPADFVIGGKFEKDAFTSATKAWESVVQRMLDVQENQDSWMTGINAFFK